MSKTFQSSFLTVTTAGIGVATVTASAATALPVDGSGNLPNFIRCAATVACHVRLGLVGQAATTADTMIQPGDAVVMAVPKGITHIAYIRNTADGFLSVVPMANS